MSNPQPLLHNRQAEGTQESRLVSSQPIDQMHVCADRPFLAGRVGRSLAPMSSPVRAAVLSDYPVKAAATPALLAYVAAADWGCAYTSAG